MAPTPTPEPDEPQTPDELLVAALARGVTYEQASTECGLSKRTINRRMANHAFRDRVVSARREWLDLATSAIAAALHEAVDTLKSLMRSGESETARLGAARALVGMLLPLRQSVDFEERLARIEGKR